ncbi:MAG: peptide/nickel transport system substrate-binding protein [Candidatus Magnetoglobus multicellularis str. Araruama]|uniref:Peptide/nickel transport system substrate-binding protein n=1 Tax=Candidatus Magnetoglobus multicellularis str. Araruama TaxID=890399 RepID=A0A1V1P8P6_9BACT|nr:MAG: peptide/nickel transport system substrate-binding protein [Candidatus Magnetoglobus multicellularis str. Araruama]
MSNVLKNTRFDAIFLAGIHPSAAEIIKQIREVGVYVPILGTHQLDYDELLSIAGKTAEGTIVNTSFDQNLPNNYTQNFVKQFKKKYIHSPDSFAAQGYDALKLLAFCINKGDSPRPVVINTTLRCMKKWSGTLGDYTIDKNGSICPNQIFFKKFNHGMFEFIEDNFKSTSGIDLVKDVTIRIPVNGVILNVDPGYTLDDTSIDIIEQLFLGLTDFTPKTYEIAPELATSWTSSSNNEIYTFTMRKDCVWTNGQPVTAHDIVWTIRRNIKPENNCSLSHILYILKNAQSIHKGQNKNLSNIGVSAIDDYTVQFNLEYPASYFPALTGLPVFRPLNRKAIETYGKDWVQPQNIQTNGSYRLVNWSRSSMMILRKNIKYFDAENVSIQEIRYYIIPNNTLGLSMYLCDELDILGANYLKIPNKELPFIQSHPILRKQYYKESKLNIYGYGFNVNLPPVDNVLVRKAIISAIDRERLIKLVLRGGEKQAKTLTPPSIFGAVDNAEDIGIDFNPVLAKQLLSQAGYPDGKNFPMIELSYNISEFHEQLARAISLFLETYLNIKVKLSAMPWSIFSRTDRKSTHMFRFSWTADYPDANNFLNELFHPSKSINKICWNNKKYAKIVEMAAVETNISKRKEFYKQAEKILVEEDAAFIPLFYDNAHCLVKPRVKNWYYMVMGGQHIRDWYLK